MNKRGWESSAFAGLELEGADVGSWATSLGSFRLDVCLSWLAFVAARVCLSSRSQQLIYQNPQPFRFRSPQLDSHLLLERLRLGWRDLEPLRVNLESRLYYRGVVQREGEARAEAFHCEPAYTVQCNVQRVNKGRVLVACAQCVRVCVCKGVLSPALLKKLLALFKKAPCYAHLSALADLVVAAWCVCAVSTMVLQMVLRAGMG